MLNRSGPITMPDPLTQTFHVLETTENPNAIDVLIAALNVRCDSIQVPAVSALLERGNTRGQIEIVRQWGALAPPARRLAEERSAKLVGALRHCLFHGEATLQHQALEIVRSAKQGEYLSVLLEALQRGVPELKSLVVDTFRHMIRRVYDEDGCGAETSEESSESCNISQARRNVLSQLDEACLKFDALRHPEPIVEAILILGSPGHFAVRKVFTRAGADCAALAGRILKSSAHPGVMHLILGCLSKCSPPDLVLEAVQSRDDLTFICHLLRWFPEETLPIQQKNVRKIERLAWVGPSDDTLKRIPPELHGSLARFISATGLPDEQKTPVYAWLQEHGSQAGPPTANRAAASWDREPFRTMIFHASESDSEFAECEVESDGRQTRGFAEVFSPLIAPPEISVPEADCLELLQELLHDPEERVGDSIENPPEQRRASTEQNAPVPKIADSDGLGRPGIDW